MALGGELGEAAPDMPQDRCTRASLASALFVPALLVLAVASCSEVGPGDGQRPTGDPSGLRGDGGGNTGGDGSANTGGDGGGNTGGDGAIGPGTDGGTMSGGDGGGSAPDAANSGGGCVATETCGNGIDDDCNMQVDDGCVCTLSTTQRCYGGMPSQAGVGVCTWGMQTCVPLGEIGAWGPCMGDGRPQQVMCGTMTDSHCNGILDEGCECGVGEQRACYDGPAGTAGVGICRAGVQDCVVSASSATWGACTGQVLPAMTNRCDGNDNLCNGMPFAGCACTPGESRACYEGPMGTLGVGLCVGGTQACQDVNGVPTWGACTGQVLPAPNTCDGIDRQCDGNPTGGTCGCVLGTTRGCYEGPAGTAGVGVCVGGTQTCEPGPGGMGSAWGACGGQVVPSVNTCDGVDRMCDGMPLAGCACVVATTRACYSGPAGTRGVGVCRDGTEACVALGMGSDWSGACTGEQGPAAAEVCGNGVDDNCNGAADEGCGPQIQCPGPLSTPAGTAVSITANASSPTGIVGYAWTIVNAPAGGVGTPNQWTPPSQDQATESFLPFIVGVYTVQVTAVDGAGQQASCQVEVTSVGHGLRVQLSWDGAGDVDLHLHAPNTTSPWFRATQDDCFYANLQPIWDGASPATFGGNPSLDFDNVTANGPENTRVDTAQLNVPYTIGVHNYARAAGRVATVDVFCGGVTSPTQTFVSRPLQGNASGDSSSNDFWRVAQVVFTSPTTCVITPLNTYGPSSVYNSSY